MAGRNGLETDIPIITVQALSMREAQIADLVLQGLSNRQIAKLLNIDESMVSMDLFYIFTKLVIGSRVELILLLTTVAHQSNRLAASA